MDTTKEKGPQPAAPSSNGTHPTPAKEEDTVAAQQEFADARSSTQPPPPPPKPNHWVRFFLILGAVAVGIAVGAYFLIPVIVTAMNTVSTDDAYVNGHVTFVAPRVSGQVTHVLVDDNVRVTKGALLAQLDKEPYVVQVRIRKAAVDVARTDLTAAQAQVRGLEALARSQRWQIEMAIQQVRNKVAALHADVAAYESKKATRTLAQANLVRGEELAPSGGISKEDLDQRRSNLKIAEADVQQALQVIYADRVYLGLAAEPEKGKALTDVPPNLDQTFSSVRSSLASFLQTTSQIGLPLPSTELTPSQVLEEFRKRDANGDVDRLLKSIVLSAPSVKQAAAKLLQAQRDLEQAELNLSYCDIVSEIDGIVTRRNVNPGNNISAGQSVMAVRSVREIWIDANFKETQLADLRIGQRARLEVDMYGTKHEFEGRITGFTMGTGSTLSLLPAQNATGNFVKVVQRLPVRIELTKYDPDKEPLFIGLSVVPYVYFKEPPQGPHAGDRLQPFTPLPSRPVSPSVNSPPTPLPIEGEIS